MKSYCIIMVTDPDAPTEFWTEGPYDATVEDCWGTCFCCGENRHSSCCFPETALDDCEC